PDRRRISRSVRSDGPSCWSLELDARAEHREELGKPRGVGGPRGCRDQIAVDDSFGHGYVGESTASLRYVWRNSRITTALLPFQNAGSGQDLRAVTDCGYRLICGGEVTDDLQHAGIRTDVIEGGVEGEVVAALFRVGLVAFEIMDRRADYIAGFLAWANGVDGMPNHQ